MNSPFSLLPSHSRASSPCRLSQLQLCPCLRHRRASWPTRLCGQPAGGCERGAATEEEAGSLQVQPGGLRKPLGPGSGPRGSYSWVGAGCCSWPTTTRQWIRRRTPDRCSSPGSGCGGAADASLGAHGLAATVAAPPRFLALRPRLLLAFLACNCGGGPHESVCRRRRNASGAADEGGRPCATHGGTVRFSEVEEEQEEGGRPQLRVWGSRPAGMKVGFPSDVEPSCG